jgi:hypothetical protein
MQPTLPVNPAFDLKVPQGLCTPRAFVAAVLEDYQDHSAYGIDNWTHDYVEPGYSTPDRGILFGNWNTKQAYVQGKGYVGAEDTRPKRFAAIAEYAGYALEWSDEWSTCEDCGKAFRTSPDSYSWLPAYVTIGDCSYVCHECVDWADYVESELLNEVDKADTNDIDLASMGFTKWNDERFESGFHPGQTDKPRDIVKRLPSGHDYVFQIDGKGQFDISFSVWIRKQETGEYDNE